MAHASYSMCRRYKLLWRWEADHRGAATAHGYSLSKTSARWAARTWLRNQRNLVASVGRADLSPDAERIAAE